MQWAEWMVLWLNIAMLALFLFAGVLWLTVAPWLASLYHRASAWLSPHLRYIYHTAAVWAGAIGIRWQTARRAVVPALAHARRWLATRLAISASMAGITVMTVMTCMHRAFRSIQAPMQSTRLATADDANSDEFEISQEDLNPTGETMPAWHFAGGPAPWGTRLSSRARAGRGVIIACAISLALFVVVGGASSLLDGLRQWASALAPPAANAAPRPQLNASFWVGRRVPSPAVYVRGISLVPSTASSALAYACWVEAPRDTRDTVPSVNLYVTADGARSWQPVPTLAGSAGSCHAVADAADPERLLLVLAPALGGSCAAPKVYDSADRGASWVAVALPDDLASACDLTLYQWHGAIFAWSPGAAAQVGGGLAAQLLVSEDDGGSWQPAFNSAPAQAGVALVAARMDGALLVLVSAPAGRNLASSGPQRTLWCRAAPDTSWQSLGALPAGTSSAYAADGQHTGSGCAWGTLYAAGYTSDGDATVARLESNDGHGWSALPPLPIAGASADRPLTTDGNVLTVGPNDLLLVDSIYTGPGLGITNGTSAPAHTFWGWDLHSHRWLTDIHIAPANSSIDGFVWDYTQAGAPRLICWVYTLNAGIPAYTGLYRASFAAPAAPSQDIGGQRAPGL